MADVVLSAQGVGKKFSKTLKSMMAYGAQDILLSTLGVMPRTDELRGNEFWAVEGVDFELKRGESLGIIGPNGSGKTTLLRMLNGIFMPDKGRIEVKGKIGGLIHVGAGFHPMLTGRENIYINGAILGMSKKDIDRKFDAIAAFADIGDFLDAPVKQYSSGMYIRLGFAIAVHSDPDILLIDEILAVGDRDFSIKCYQKMKEIREQGATIVLVSHNEYIIRERTQRALYLKSGRPRFLGPSEEAISLYIKDDLEAKATRMQQEARFSADPLFKKKAMILGLEFLDKEGKVINSIESGQELKAVVSYKAFEAVDHPVFSVNFYNDQGLVYAANSAYEGVEFLTLSPGEGKMCLRIPQCHLPTETYYVSVIIAQNESCDPVDLKHFAYTLVVGRAKNARGLLKFPVEWSLGV